MPFDPPSKALRSAKKKLRELEDRFLSTHLAPVLPAPTAVEQLDVAAYAVLSHGVFEHLFEEMALWRMERAVELWTNKKRLNRCSFAMALFHSENAVPTAGTTFDRIRLALDSAKTNVSKSVNKNNGISKRDLEELFCPLGVDVPSTTVLIASLAQLVEQRHQWAHRSRVGATVVKSASDLKTYVGDVLTLAEAVAKQASKI